MMHIFQILAMWHVIKLGSMKVYLNCGVYLGQCPLRRPLIDMTPNWMEPLTESAEAYQILELGTHK